jgi:hypothetical protein
MALLPLQDGFQGNSMQSFAPGLVDRSDADDTDQQHICTAFQPLLQQYSIRRVRSAP